MTKEERTLCVSACGHAQRLALHFGDVESVTMMFLASALAVLEQEGKMTEWEARERLIEFLHSYKAH